MDSRVRGNDRVSHPIVIPAKAEIQSIIRKYDLPQIIATFTVTFFIMPVFTCS